MEIVDKKIEEYIDYYSSEENDILKKINRETHLKQIHPRMLAGNIQGKLIEMISKMIKPMYILEIGTFTAYSTICLAEGLAENGKLITIEKNRELENTIKDNIDNYSKKSQIELIIGDANDVLPNLDYMFDLVFIDADKENYIKYINYILPKINKGGYVIADNVLWSGKVVDINKNSDKDTKGIHDFNVFIKNSKEFENVIIPIRDGISIIRRK